ATRSKANHLHASDSAWYTFPLFRSGGGILRVPGRPSQANRIALGAERGGTESRKGYPYWSGDAADGDPAHPAITIVTERSLLGVGSSALALRCPSRGDQSFVLHA
uniref:Uncharacterized protein n=1 Tax=Capra hircus TaxID=9925 RepID=A0A452FZM8_CAPHI